ncbi:hypothetical protein [Chitinophaga sp. MD30]|uniref:hypothetical protein n=1 Tax=Chitinophaga sp. MD30 TaxID=2033437 RepID=UPI0012FD5471|nr:hypothetical protein [Chitinophaga sp. MD30]
MKLFITARLTIACMAIACALKAQDASVFKYQDTKQISDINNLTGNGCLAFCIRVNTLPHYYSTTAATHPPPGLFQMETFFNGDIRFRSKIDNMQWSAWKTIWTTQNFNADDYMTRKLDVWNTDAAKKERFFFATNGTTYFKGYGSTPFDWWGENGSLMKMSGNGNIGLGTDPSQEKLNVAGPIRSGIMSFGSTGDEYVAVSAKNILNVGYDRHGSILIGSNLFLDNGTLYTAKVTHNVRSSHRNSRQRTRIPGQRYLLYQATIPGHRRTDIYERPCYDHHRHRRPCYRYQQHLRLQTGRSRQHNHRKPESEKGYQLARLCIP